MIFMKFALGLFLFASILGTTTEAMAERYFYYDRDFGSDAYFNPVSSFVNYSVDTLQIPASFDDKELDDRWNEVRENLINPGAAIESSGGVDNFIHTQIFPIYYDDRFADSIEMIPNYTLHLIGGGMVYRKNVEWFDARGYRYSWLWAATLGMAAEVVQEVLEKKSTDSDDEVADVYIFRPLGMLLFSFDGVSRFFAETMGLVEWAHIPMYNLREGGLRNLGQNFAARPPLFGESAPVRPFIYFSGVTLFGLSHRVGDDGTISWGAGSAVVVADPLELRTSGGLFYDRAGSLLASMIVNGTEDLALRVNIYPGAIWRSPLLPGFFLGVDDDRNAMAGVAIGNVPIGALWGGAEK